MKMSGGSDKTKQDSCRRALCLFPFLTPPRTCREILRHRDFLRNTCPSDGKLPSCEQSASLWLPVPRLVCVVSNLDIVFFKIWRALHFSCLDSDREEDPSSPHRAFMPHFPSLRQAGRRVLGLAPKPSPAPGPLSKFHGFTPLSVLRALIFCRLKWLKGVSVSW